MNVTRWVDRKFEFTMPVSLFPVVLERLRGAPARMEDKVRNVPGEILTRREGDRWSAQEHAGHLVDLDELHAGRLEDFRAGAKTLRAWDVTNRKTFDANYNARPIGEIVMAFRGERGAFVKQLEEWKDEEIARTAIHPRLQQPMRVIDMAFFVAEHDDHHLAVMSELIRRFGARRA
ncbi:MAG TPA: DinB family protein [Candidatus Eisenbacteria bacterium]|nr:DinB family protein [Candidatus Eisenbacteria bacterium]